MALPTKQAPAEDEEELGTFASIIERALQKVMSEGQELATDPRAWVGDQLSMAAKYNPVAATIRTMPAVAREIAEVSPAVQVPKHLFEESAAGVRAFQDSRTNNEAAAGAAAGRHVEGDNTFASVIADALAAMEEANARPRPTGEASGQVSKDYVPKEGPPVFFPSDEAADLENSVDLRTGGIVADTLSGDGTRPTEGSPTSRGAGSLDNADPWSQMAKVAAVTGAEKAPTPTGEKAGGNPEIESQIRANQDAKAAGGGDAPPVTGAKDHSGPLDHDEQAILLKDFQVTHGGPYNGDSNADRESMWKLRRAREQFPDATSTQLAMKIYRGEFD